MPRSKDRNPEQESPVRVKQGKPPEVDISASSGLSGSDFFSTGGVAPQTPPDSASPGSQQPDIAKESDRVTLMGRFHLMRCIGEGGMGKVFLARDSMTQQELALKLIHPNLSNDETTHAKFVQELSLTQNLTHPNIVRSFSLQRDEERSLTFFTMEYVKGQSLEELLEEQEEGEQCLLPLEQSKEIFNAVGSALSYAHKRGVVHRDIKPANVLLSEDGDIKIMDFGIARSVTAGEEKLHTGHVGTVYYMAPEQLKGSAPVSQAADQYSLAVMMYELLTGDLPVGNAPPPSELSEEIPKALDPVLMQALSTRPERRFPSIQEFADKVNAAMEKSTQSKNSRRWRDQRSPRKNRRRRRKPRQRSVTVNSLEEAVNQFVDNEFDKINKQLSSFTNQIFGGGQQERRRKRRKRVSTQSTEKETRRKRYKSSQGEQRKKSEEANPPSRRFRERKRREEKE